MHFGYTLPAWALALVVVAGTLAGFGIYARVRSLTSGRRVLLGGLRGLALVVLLLVLFRPMYVGADRDRRGAVVPILVDQSASMRIRDMDGRRRTDVAADLLKHTILPALAGRFQPEVLAFGDVIVPRDADHLSSPDLPQTRIRAALASVRERYRDRLIAGTIVLSDGGETDPSPASEAGSQPDGRLGPIFAFGIGGSPPDREVRRVAADSETLAGSLVDLDAEVVSRGLGDDAFDLQLVANGQVVETRRVSPGDGVPLHVRFSVAPPAGPTVYSVQIPAEARETVVENNSASVLVSPPGRKRRILFVQGAPGFEHSFLLRAWTADPGIEVDAVVPKGKNDQGRDTYFVQADPARAPALLGGYPTTKAALFDYDAIVFGSVEWDFLTRDQLTMTADFIRERGGGVLVLGARSFASPGLAGSALAESLPLGLLSGRPPVAQTASTTEHGDENRLQPTDEGRQHLLRIASSPEESERAWSVLPPLASVNVPGPPKPGAEVLAEVRTGGRMQPLLAAQRYGRGRTAEFTGEGSWRWKMLMPAPDRTHELFWRQVIRWLSGAAPDDVMVVPTTGAQPRARTTVDVLVADADFHAAADASVSVRVTAPDGDVQTPKATLADGASGRYEAWVNVDRAGMYQVQAEARRRSTLLGTASASFLAGASDPEFADPRLNAALLKRIAGDSGGRYLTVADADLLATLLDASARAAATTSSLRPRDLWQNPLVFAWLLGVLAAEWLLRRRWGLA